MSNSSFDKEEKRSTKEPFDYDKKLPLTEYAYDWWSMLDAMAHPDEKWSMNDILKLYNDIKRKWENGEKIEPYSWD